MVERSLPMPGGYCYEASNHHRRFIDRFAECFTDYRDPERTEHSLLDLLKQRIIAIALGYGDLNDHDRLRYDPLLAVLVDKNEPTGKDRRCVKNHQIPLAGKSTLNRLELTPADADQNSRYKKIVYHQDKIEYYFVDMFLASYKKAPQKIVLDLDNSDDIIHGNQEGRFFTVTTITTVIFHFIFFVETTFWLRFYAQPIRMARLVVSTISSALPNRFANVGRKFGLSYEGTAAFVGMNS